MEVIDRSFAGESFLTEMTHKCRAFRRRQLGERSTRSPNKPLLPQCPHVSSVHCLCRNRTAAGFDGPRSASASALGAGHPAACRQTKVFLTGEEAALGLLPVWMTGLFKAVMWPRLGFWLCHVMGDTRGSNSSDRDAPLQEGGTGTCCTTGYSPRGFLLLTKGHRANAQAALNVLPPRVTLSSAAKELTCLQRNS